MILLTGFTLCMILLAVGLKLLQQLLKRWNVTTTHRLSEEHPTELAAFRAHATEHGDTWR